jgi:hypothetical protein
MTGCDKCNSYANGAHEPPHVFQGTAPGALTKQKYSGSQVELNPGGFSDETGYRNVEV